MSSSAKQLIVIADTLPRYLRNKSLTFYDKLSTHLNSVSLVYTTLLPGPELEVAKIAYIRNIPYIVLIPYRNISKRWPQSFKDRYNFYIKKSIKNIIIDREHEYISEIEKPDLYNSEKILNYLRWIIDVPVRSPLETEFLFFARGMYSSKMNNLYRLTNFHSTEKNLKIIQTTFMNCYEDEHEKDIMPF